MNKVAFLEEYMMKNSNWTQHTDRGLYEKPKAGLGNGIANNVNSRAKLLRNQ